jgi:FMN phosphatase YigB (HAD superfamily)
MIDAEIFDMDGTLCDVSSIRHFLEGKTRNFDRFHSESINCPPHLHVVEGVHAAREAGRAVLIVTARVARHMYTTLLWLHENDIEHDDLWMRRDGDYRPDYIVKAEILADIRRQGYNPVHAWDDNPNVIRLWEENGIPTTIVAGWIDGPGIREDEA